MFRRLLRLLHPLHLVVVLAWANLSACAPAPDPEAAEAFAALQLSIEHRVGVQPFRPGQSEIHTVAGAWVRVDSLRYELSHPRQVGSDGRVRLAPWLADIHGAARPVVSAHVAERYARVFRLAACRT